MVDDILAEFEGNVRMSAYEAMEAGADPERVAEILEWVRSDVAAGRDPL